PSLPAMGIGRRTASPRIFNYTPKQSRWGRRPLAHPLAAKVAVPCARWALQRVSSTSPHGGGLVQARSRDPLQRDSLSLGRAGSGHYTLQAMQKVNSALSRGRSARVPRILLLLVGLGGCALVLRQGLMPWAINPLPAVDLGQSRPWFIDWRLAAL